MLEEKIEIWPAELIFDGTLLTYTIHNINFDYLEDSFFCFTKLSNNDTKEFNKTLEGLDNTGTIFDKAS